MTELTDDELIARVLDLAKCNWSEKGMNGPGIILAGLAPDLARRLQKANERIRELENPEEEEFKHRMRWELNMTEEEEP